MLLSWVSKYDGRGTAAARKDMARLGKTAIGTKVTIAALTYAFGRLAASSVKAAAAEQQSITQLNKALENQGFGKQVTQVNDFITRLQNTTGVLDNELRPAYLQLFNSMQDANAAQEMLSKSLDYAAGTGKDLTSVTTALSRAFAGNRESLNELNTGLDKTFLKTASLRDIIAALDAKFRGEAQAATATFAGQLIGLQTQLTNLQEVFGKGFISQLGVGSADMAKFTDGVYNLGRALGWLVDKAAGVASWFSNLNDNFTKFAQNTLGWSKWRRKDFKDPMGTLHDSITKPLTGGAQNTNALLAYFKRLEALQKRLAADAAAKARAAAAQKAKQAELDKQSAKLAQKFDIEAINIQLALSRAQDQTTKDRLEALKTLNDLQYVQNDSLSSMDEILNKINDSLKKMGEQASAAATETEKLAKTSLQKAIDDAKAYADRLDSIRKAAEAASAAVAATLTANYNGGMGRDPFYNTPTSNAASLSNITQAQAAAALTNMFPEADRASMGSGNYGSYGTQVTNNITVNALSTLDVEEAIANAVNSGSRSGLSYAQVFSRL